MTGLPRCLVGSLLVLAVIAQYASANIAFECYELRRPDEAEIPVGAFLHELGKRGYTAEPRDVMDHLGNQVAHPAITNPKLTARQLLAELGNAHAQWTRAQDFKKLVPALATVVAKAFDNPALVVTDQSIRSNLQNVLLDLALGYGKLAHQLEQGVSKTNDPKVAASIKLLRKSSDEMMAEWIRTFSGEVITQKGNGPEAEKLYVRVRDESNKLGRGVLLVTIDDPDVRFYVNESFRSTLQAIPDLLPGRYRILAMGPNDDARLFIVDVLPNQTTRLDIHWDVSSNLVTGTSSVALVFGSTQHPEPSPLACELARAAGHSTGGVVLVGMDIVDLQWRMTASQYHIQTCQLARSGYVLLEKAVSTKSAKALADFIAGGTHDNDVVVTADTDLSAFQKVASRELSTAAAERPVMSPPMRSAWLPWAAASGSAVMLAAGGYALYKHYAPCGIGTNESDCKFHYRRARVIGYVASGTGVALGTLTAYWFLHDPKDGPPRWPAKWLTIGGSAAIALGVGLYAIDQDDGHTDSRGYVTEYYPDTAPIGIVLGVAGLAAIGVGVWSWTRDGTSLAPAVSVSSSHAILEWAGSF
jgi:hypothetical protein